MQTAVTERLTEAAAILEDFLASSGLTTRAPPRRYLWTDAFAVMTLVGLQERTGEHRFLDLAQHLIDQVHQVLRPQQGDGAHPTALGLRIGKPVPERKPHEPYDPRLEWERDGQYYHYLTKWMQALERTASATGDERYHGWAVDLAQAAHRAFAYPAGDPKSLYWKMSVDLSRPLVPSMGAHDPLDGLVVAQSLGLEREARELAGMCEHRRWVTDDALGSGGLLVDALRLARLVARGRKDLQSLLSAVVEDAEISVKTSTYALAGPATRRLAFRELGLALGLHAVRPLSHYIEATRLERFVPVASILEDFWSDAQNQATPSWTAHRDINAITLAACLAPHGALG